MRRGRPGERWVVADVCDDCAYDSETLRIGTATEKAAARKALRARQSGAMESRRRKNPDGKVLATTAADRELLLGVLRWAWYEAGAVVKSRRQRGEVISREERDYQDRLADMYTRIENL